MRPIGEAQDLILGLIRLSGQWNAFDGAAIEAALRANAELWRSVFFAREGSTLRTGTSFGGPIDLIVLRDLPGNAVNMDTLFLLAEPGQQEALQGLAEGWQADEVHWIGQDEAFRAMGDSAIVNKSYANDPDRVILRVWWD